MRVNSTASNLSGALRSRLGAALALLFCFSAASAQNNPPNPQASGEGNGAAASATEKGGDRLAALRAQIEAAQTDADRARLERTLVDYLVALGRKSEAVGELRGMAREERVDPIGFYNLGNALARLGDTDTAIDAYRKAIKQRHGNYSRAQNNLGVLLLRQGRWDEAQEAFVAALRLENFRYAEASYNLGRLYATRGEADLAMREWSRALLVQPDHADAAIALARAYAEDGRPERGLALLDGFIARRGPSVELTDARREILYGGAENEANEAPGTGAVSITGAARPVKVSNENRVAAAGSKNQGAKTEGGKRASTSLRQLTVDQETYELLRRARAAREDGRNEDAAVLYNRVLSRSNGFLPPANLELSFVMSSLNRHDEAAAALTTLVNREGARYPIAYYYLGRQYELLGKLSPAADAFEKAAAAFGETSPQFLLDVSRVREKEGDAARALAAMEAYVRISQSQGHVPDWSAARLAQLREKAKVSEK